MNGPSTCTPRTDAPLSAVPDVGTSCGKIARYDAPLDVMIVGNSVARHAWFSLRALLAANATTARACADASDAITCGANITVDPNRYRDDEKRSCAPFGEFCSTERHPNHTSLYAHRERDADGGDARASSATPLSARQQQEKERERRDVTRGKCVACSEIGAGSAVAPLLAVLGVAAALSLLGWAVHRNKRIREELSAAIKNDNAADGPANRSRGGSF